MICGACEVLRGVCEVCYVECMKCVMWSVGYVECVNFFVDNSGKRPFGVSILYIGWDPHFGFQLYQSDPSGNYGGWKATCIGNNHQVWL